MKFYRLKLKRNNKPSKVSKKTLFVGLLTLLFLVGIVFSTIQSAAFGANLVDYEKQARMISEENEELSKKIINSLSLSEIGKSAEELGFIKPDKILYLSKSSEVANLP